VRQELFEQRYRARWEAFAQWLESDSSRARRNNAAALASDIPRRYREMCQHLALARDRQYGSALIDQLHDLVLRGHQRLYGTPRFTVRPIIAFFAAGFPRLVRARRRTVIAAMALLFGPFMAAAIGAYHDPSFAFTLLEPEQLGQYASMYEPNNPRVGKPRGADTDLAAFGFYIANNVRIDFQCFAGGILFGLGAIFFLVYNGLVTGAVAGYVSELGYLTTFWSFVSGHSALELVGAGLSGAAGLELGMALVAPGRLTRPAALKERGKIAVRLLYGAAAMTVFAAVIEAFWSGNGAIAVPVKYSVGVIMSALVILYFLLAGRRGH
jgi:uncharacterized membrane protein SpoIIM required for sporulation